MKLALKKASTDVTVYLFIQDADATDGAGKTGLAYNTSNLRCYYVRPGGNAAILTATTTGLATQTVTGAHSDGGFVEVDATNMPGVYRLDLPDAVCATGVNSVMVMLKGAADMAPCVLEIQLTNVDLNDGVRAGITALPNAAAEAAGGLITFGTAAGRLNVSGGRADADVINWKTATAPAMPTNFAATAISAAGVVNADVKAWDGTTVPTAATVADVWSYTDGAGRTLTAATNVTSTGGTITLGDSGEVDIASDSVVASVTGSVGSVGAGGIAAASIASNAITADKIASGAIDADAIASNAITSAKIATDAIGADQVAAAAVTKVAGGVLSNTSNKLATDASGRVTPRLERITKGTEFANFHFPMKLAADGSLATGKTITGQYVQDGGSALATLDGTITEVTGTGIYKVSLTAAETNCDVLTLVFTETDCSTSVITLITQSQS